MTSSAAVLVPQPKPSRASGLAPAALSALGLALAVLALSWVSIEIPRELGRTSPLWIANAVVLAVLLNTERRRWALLLAAGVAGNLMANLLAGDGPVLAVLFAFCNGLEIAVSALILRAVVGRELDFSRVRHLTLFCLVSGIAAPLVSAAIATTALWLNRGAPFLTTFITWAAADGLGALLVTPTILTLYRASGQLAQTPVRPLGLLSLALLAAVSMVVFTSGTPLLFLLPPLLLLVVFQMEMLGSVLGVMIIAAAGLGASVMGLDPAVVLAPTDTERLLLAQVFLAVMLLTSLPTATVLAQRRRLQSELTQARDRAEAAAAEAAEQFRRAQFVEDVARVGYFRVARETGCVTWSDRMFDLFGVPRGEIPDLAASMAVFHPDDRAAVTALFKGAIERGEGYETATRLVMADGAVRHVFGRTTCEVGADGTVLGLVGTMVDITDIKQAEAKVAESESAFRRMAENASDMILRIGLDGRMLYVSPSSEAILGYTPADLMGKVTFGFIHPDDAGVMLDASLACLRSGGRILPERIRYRALHKDGRTLWLEARPNPMIDPSTGRIHAFTDIVRDITAEVAAEEALTESEMRFRNLAESSHDIIVRVGMDDRVTYTSPSIGRLGYRADELVGLNRNTLVHPDDLARMQAGAAEMARTGRPPALREREHRIRASDGVWRWFEGSPSILRNDAGQPIEYVTALRDITERKALETALEQAKAVAEAAAAVKGEFLANMSHELRTPLTSVLGFTRLALEQPELSDASRGHIAKAARAGEALLTTVNDILDFSKLEAGQVEIRPRACDAVTACRETLELFEQAATEKGLTLAFEAGEVPPSLSLDPERLRQLLLNLIGNAVKFSDRGQITLGVGWRAGDSRLTVEVRDQGQGIAKAQQDLLFKRFSQVDGSSTRRHGGTGLGLAICMGLAETMGGSIGVESAEGQGARFFFEITAPVAEVPHQASGGLAGLTVSRGVRVLVADDHAVNRELVRAVLTPMGVILSEAADGAEAVAMAAAEPFDLIYMDLRMPVMDGLSAVRAIRDGGGPNADAPIIAFSAGSEALDDAGRHAAGFDGALAKPMLPAELLAMTIRFTSPDMPLHDEDEASDAA
ncbi:MAG: hypothetical protein JWP35_2761 [Caulobacter sp.]|nr:hypothetical protein [Caulobacter sp.]